MTATPNPSTAPSAEPVAIGGLDPAARDIGYATPSGHLLRIHIRTGPEDPIRRLGEVYDRTRNAIATYPPTPDTLLIEGYSLGGPGNRQSTLITLGEVGGVIRLAFYHAGTRRIIPIPPTSLKKYATGRGDADKALMVRSARTRSGIDRGISDDEADAYHLRDLGRVAFGLDQARYTYQADTIANLNIEWSTS